MGQRSQIYVRYNVGEEKKLIAKYFGWNYGERMISRARWGIELILEDVNVKKNTAYQYECQEKRLSRIFDVNFDLHDIAISCDIIKEWEEQFPDEDFNEYVFEMQHCNDGKLLIDICENAIKYAFLNNESLDVVMDGEEYMRWDSPDGEDWKENAYLSQNEIKTCEKNIQYISNHAVLMTTEEVEEFVTYDYRKQEKAKKEVLINAIDYEDLEPVSVLLRLMVDDDMGKPEIEHAIHLACKEYCQIEGKTHGSFNYGDFDALVPNDICEKYGIAKLEIPFEQMDVAYGKDLTEECHYNSVIWLNQKQADILEKMMNMNGETIRKVYGYKAGTAFSFSSSYFCGMEVEVHLVICEDETPYVEGILFDHGQQVACTEPCFDSILGVYFFDYQDDTYTVTVKAIDSGSGKEEPRFKVVMTSDAFPDPEDIFAIWDSTIGNYYADEDGSVQTFSDETSAQMYLSRLIQTCEYVELEAERQWKENQEKTYGAWTKQSEEERNEYRKGIYEDLLSIKETLDIDIVMPKSSR